VFDECHHLPAEAYALAARHCLAPFRLGLTATLERADGREAVLEDLIGPVVYRKEIVDLSGEYLADYETEQITISLSPSERAEYEAERAIYLGFLRAQGIRMSGPTGWLEFIQRASRGTAGRRALQAYRRQRELALAAPAKLDYLELLIETHRDDLMLVFTQDNATAHQVSRRFLVPSITHQTKVTERSQILERFAQRKTERDAIIVSRARIAQARADRIDIIALQAHRLDIRQTVGDRRHCIECSRAADVCLHRNLQHAGRPQPPA